MRKLTKTILKILKNPFVKITLYLLLLLGIFALAFIYNGGEGFLTYIIAVVTDQGTIAFFFAGIVAIIASTLVEYSGSRLEESMKIIDDHHQIICKYNGHKIDKVRDTTKDFFNKDGMVMELHHTRVNKPIKNKVKDIYSAEYKSMEEEADLFNNHGVLLLPTVNVYTNMLGQCKFNIKDSNEVKELPPFVIGNGTEFLKAHRYSQTSNNLTIRLDDISMECNIIFFHTNII